MRETWRENKVVKSSRHTCKTCRGLHQPPPLQDGECSLAMHVFVKGGGGIRTSDISLEKKKRLGEGARLEEGTKKSRGDKGEKREQLLLDRVR